MDLLMAILYKLYVPYREILENINRRHIKTKLKAKKINDSKNCTTGTECAGLDRRRSLQFYLKNYKYSECKSLYYLLIFLIVFALCHWILQTLIQIPQFLTQVLFTNFPRNAIMNFHNEHIWENEYLHKVCEIVFNISSR